jgi:hypothetical protein
MQIAFACPDDSMPRTVFYDRFAQAVKASAHFTIDETAADVVFPAEDTAMESNWPCYGNQRKAYIKGVAPDQAQYEAYLKNLQQQAQALRRPLCIVNMHPLVRLPEVLQKQSDIFIADGCLSEQERTINPRTISMPALPVITAAAPPPPKTVLASFRGVLSHPSRRALLNLHNGDDIVCQIMPRENHVGLVDATSGKIDQAYVDLMAKSVFAFVPRGDALFSYRLLEAMSFGCIPVVLSDGWVLPFDRTVAWQNVALRVPEAAIAGIPAFLKFFPKPRIAEMQREVSEIYSRHFVSLDVIVKRLLTELSRIVGTATEPS